MATKKAKSPRKIATKPPTREQLAEAITRRVESRLRELGSDVCRVCGKSDMTLEGGAMLAYAPGTGVDPSAVLSMVAVICNGCGHAEMFSLGILAQEQAKTKKARRK